LNGVDAGVVVVSDMDTFEFEEKDFGETDIVVSVGSVYLVFERCGRGR
jgi:hypothetical protein